jgi:hypothetical protein
VELEAVFLVQPVPFAAPGVYPEELLTRACAEDGFSIVLDSGGLQEITLARGDRYVCVPRSAVLAYRKATASPSK